MGIETSGGKKSYNFQSSTYGNNTLTSVNNSKSSNTKSGGQSSSSSVIITRPEVEVVDLFRYDNDNKSTVDQFVSVNFDKELAVDINFNREWKAKEREILAIYQPEMDALKEQLQYYKDLLEKFKEENAEELERSSKISNTVDGIYEYIFLQLKDDTYYNYLNDQQKAELNKLLNEYQVFCNEQAANGVIATEQEFQKMFAEEIYKKYHNQFGKDGLFQDTIIFCDWGEYTNLSTRDLENLIKVTEDNLAMYEEMCKVELSQLEKEKKLAWYQREAENSDYQSFVQNYDSTDINFGSIDYIKFQELGCNINAYIEHVREQYKDDPEKLEAELNKVYNIDVVALIEWAKANYDENSPEFGQIFANYNREYEFYMYTSEKDKELFHYLMAKDPDMAYEYLNQMQEKINQAKGAKMANEFINSLDLTDSGELDTTLCNLLGVTNEGLGDGINNFFAGIENALAADGVISAEQYKTMLILQYLEEQGHYSETYNISMGIGNLLPSMAASAVVSFVATPAAGKIVGQGLMALSTFGNSKESALQSGASTAQANTYGALSACSEITLGYLIGNIPWLSQTASLSLSGMVQEGTEELFQTYIDAGLRAAILGETVDFGSGDLAVDGLKAFFAGFVTSGVLNTPSATLSFIYNGVNYTLNSTQIKDLTNYIAANEGTIAEYVSKLEKETLDTINDIYLNGEHASGSDVEGHNGSYVDPDAAIINNFINTYSGQNMIEVLNNFLSEDTIGILTDTELMIIGQKISDGIKTGNYTLDQLMSLNIDSEIMGTILSNITQVTNSESYKAICNQEEFFANEAGEYMYLLNKVGKKLGQDNAVELLLTSYKEGDTLYDHETIYETLIELQKPGLNEATRTVYLNAIENEIRKAETDLEQRVAHAYNNVEKIAKNRGLIEGQYPTKKEIYDMTLMNKESRWQYETISKKYPLYEKALIEEFCIAKKDLKIGDAIIKKGDKTAVKFVSTEKVSENQVGGFVTGIDSIEAMNNKIAELMSSGKTDAEIITEVKRYLESDVISSASNYLDTASIVVFKDQNGFKLECTTGTEFNAWVNYYIYGSFTDAGRVEFDVSYDSSQWLEDKDGNPAPYIIASSNYETITVDQYIQTVIDEYY